MDNLQTKQQIDKLSRALKENPEIISPRVYGNSKLYDLDKVLSSNSLFALYMLTFEDRHGKIRAYIGFTSTLQSRMSNHASSLLSKKANRQMIEAYQKSGSLPKVTMIKATKNKDTVLELETKAIEILEQLEFRGVIIKCLNISKRQYEYQLDTTPFVDRDRED